MQTPYQDDGLTQFESSGTPPLPPTNDQGHVDHDNALIWYSSAHGSGPPVILLHGGLGHSGNWGHQVPALLDSGYRPILIDTRRHGRSTGDTARPFSYELMASDVLAIMDDLHIEKAALIGWSDGACTALVLASQAPARVSGVFYFACNMDPTGTKPFEATPILNRCFSRHKRDYAELSTTPETFEDFVAALTVMQRTQPNYSAADLANINVPAVAIVHSEHDEFIRREHAEYLAHAIPHAELVVLDGVSHFAPLQRPDQFNAAMLAFLNRIFFRPSPHPDTASAPSPSSS